MGLARTADGLSSADIQGMSLDPTAQDPSEYQTPRDVVSQPGTDGLDPATPGGPAPYNGAEPMGKPVTTDPMWLAPDAPKSPPYSPTPYTGPGPSVDTTTLHNARRMPMEETMTADLWVTASQDADQELEKERMVRAKVAATAIWPFLSAAASEREFGHRLALCEDQLEVLFPEESFRSRVAKSLHEDYLVLNGAKIEDLWEDFGKTASADPIVAVAQGYDWSHHEATVEDAEGTPRPEQPQSLANPDFFSQGPEAGPVTGDSAHYPVQQAPDPFNPMNAEFPLTPTQWVVPPDATWIDRPMQFGHQASAGYVDEGVQTGLGPNPNYFAAPEGVSAGQNAFPADPSLPEENERVNMLGDVPPGTPVAAPEVSYSNAGKQASRWVVAEKDNHGACSHCNSPVYRRGDTWKHLGGDPGHGVRLHEEHPWLVAEQNRRTLAVNQDARQFQKALYANVPGPSESAKEGSRKVARWVLADASSSDMGPGGGAGQSQVDPSAAPPAPQSMQPGGAGSMAGPPLTIPNDQANTNPFATSGGGPAPVDQPTGMTNGFMASRYTAETMNRPTADNPSGVDTADEFDVNNWEAPAQQRPRQDATDRGVNTPQRPGQPIPVNSTELAEETEEERR